jgi:membrane fusion protein, multidrug efflux system
VLKRILLFVLIPAAAGALFWWQTARPISVTTAPVTRGDAAEIVYATGTVEPRNWSKVTSLVRERITSLCNCEGNPVTVGDVLARLDDTEPRAVLAELTARGDFTARELERLRGLIARNVATVQDLERAESEEARLQALIAAQRARLETYVLRAPIDGIVLRQDGEIGEVAEPGNVIFWIGQPRPLLIVAEVNEEDIPRVTPGQRTLLRADAFPDRALEAVVDSITPMGDPVAKTYRVRFALPEDTPLLIGMTVEVNVVVGVSEATLLVPAGAVEGDAVWTVEDGNAQRRSVMPGIRGTAFIEVLQGLDEGDRVIVPIPDNLRDGAAVRLAVGAP